MAVALLQATSPDGWKAIWCLRIRVNPLLMGGERIMTVL